MSLLYFLSPPLLLPHSLSCFSGSFFSPNSLLLPSFTLYCLLHSLLPSSFRISALTPYFIVLSCAPSFTPWFFPSFTPYSFLHSFTPDSFLHFLFLPSVLLHSLFPSSLLIPSFLPYSFLHSLFLPTALLHSLFPSSLIIPSFTPLSLLIPSFNTPSLLHSLFTPYSFPHSLTSALHFPFSSILLFYSRGKTCSFWTGDCSFWGRLHPSPRVRESEGESEACLTSILERRPSKRGHQKEEKEEEEAGPFFTRMLGMSWRLNEKKCSFSSPTLDFPTLFSDFGLFYWQSDSRLSDLTLLMTFWHLTLWHTFFSGLAVTWLSDLTLVLTFW